MAQSDSTQSGSLARRAWAGCCSVASVLAGVGRSTRYLALLVSLEIFTWSDAFWDEGAAKPAGRIDFEDLDILITVLVGIWAIRPKKVIVYLISILAVAALAAAWSSELIDTRPWWIAGDACMALFFAFTAGAIIHDVGKTQGVTTDTVIGSVCGYILIGATFGLLFSLTELLVPGSFASSANEGQVLAHRDYPQTMYFSYVTLSSVGYGDIVPVKNAARMLAWGEGVVGQFYMAILVARLVALHLEHARQKKQTTG